MVDSLHEYYENAGILPTVAGFTTERELDAYESMRRRVLGDRLALLPSMFSNAEILEFGPDTGENALIFSRWGARMHLVEPNPQAIPHIQKNFSRFGLSDHLMAVSSSTVEAFESDMRFDGIVAEGFIYTIQPLQIWAEKMRRFLRSDGFLIISYYEQIGACFELMLKGLYQWYGSVTQSSGVKAAQRLYGAKWDSLPHTRSFESWVMDVLENPFVRSRYFLRSGELCRDLADYGFSLYSSWPRYQDELEIYWHKKPLAYTARLDGIQCATSRSVLGFLLGRKCYYCGSSMDRLDQINEDVDLLNKGFDSLADDGDAFGIQRGIDVLNRLISLDYDKDFITTAEEDAEEIKQILGCIREMLMCVLRGDAEQLAELANERYEFINLWGIPDHYAVFTAASSDFLKL